MLRDLSIQSLFTGLLVAFVGFASSFAVVLHGITSMGASDSEAASALMALSVSMGLCGIVLSLWRKMPISVAWSTPGAAFLATIGQVEGGFSVAVGAFIISSVLIVASGMIRPLNWAISSIPPALSNAMLAGVLVGLCFSPVKAIQFDPALGAPIVIAFFIGGAINRLLAVPAALLAFIAVLAFGIEIPDGALASVTQSLVPRVEFFVPHFTIASIVSVALPLYIITMASQNIPGITILKVNGYHTPPGPMFITTGIFSLLSAPFGGHAVNLAAITAAMCAGEDAGKDPAKRYWAAVVAGAGYVVFGLLAGGVTAFVALAPKVLIEAVAGLALIGAFSGSALAAFKDAETREAAATTFITTASGISFGGISGAFWGLLAGGSVMALQYMLRRIRSR